MLRTVVLRGYGQICSDRQFGLVSDTVAARGVPEALVSTAARRAPGSAADRLARFFTEAVSIGLA